MLPVADDQPRNARRCEDLGLGIALYEEERTPGQVRDAVMAVLGDDAYRMRSMKLAATIETMPGAERGVALLERLATTRAPLPGDARANQA
jgi:UDP:flavonoid glycosyltransferase YjiC (YdhE family)